MTVPPFAQWIMTFRSPSPRLPALAARLTDPEIFLRRSFRDGSAIVVCDLILRTIFNIPAGAILSSEKFLQRRAICAFKVRCSIIIPV